jgi:hypothetical protein
MGCLKLPAICWMRPRESLIVIMANLLLVAGKRHKRFQITMSFREPNFHPSFEWRRDSHRRIPQFEWPNKFFSTGRHD